MDIEEFIEQDILVFLDQRLDQKIEDEKLQSMRVESVYLTRDYEDELYQALEKDNVTLAKHVLHDLKEKFDQIPSTSPDKKHVKALLAHLYELFKKHLIGEKVERPKDIAKKEKQEEDKKIEVVAPVEPKNPFQDDSSETIKVLDMAELHAGSGDFKQAIKDYRKAKALALNMQNVPSDLAKRFKETFARIKELMETKPDPIEEPITKVETNQNKVETKQKPVHETLDENIILELEKEKHKMDSQLKEHQVASAMKTYQKMKTLVQQIKDPKKAEASARKLIRIYSIIQSIRAKT